MFHPVEGNWNGQAAADMYGGPLLKALRRTWGRKHSYRIVEDGDRKGNQSNKGISAKHSLKIKALTLPPRSPCWMPLDYAIWDRIIDGMLAGAPSGRETKDAFIARLQHVAKKLPKGFVAKQIANMKTRVQGVIDAKGWCPKMD